MRRILSWKFVFYDLLMPVLRMLGPTRGDAILGPDGPAGHGGTAAAPASAFARRSCGPAPHSMPTGRSRRPGRRSPPTRRDSWRATIRSIAQSDEAVLNRFDVRGYERLKATLSTAAARSWSAATWVPTSRACTGSFVAAFPCGCWFSAPARLARAQSPLRRGRPAPAGRNVPAPRPLAGGRRRARLPGRAALRDGLAIYLNGDIPWSGPNTCAGRLLGRTSALSRHLDRAGRPDQRTGVPGLLHASARRTVRARDRSDRPSARRRGRIRRRRLPEAARSPDRRLTGRRRRPPRMAVLRISAGTRAALRPDAERSSQAA